MHENSVNDIQMCFIVGMGRSGTTLLTNLLNQHPEVVAMPENNFVLFGKKLTQKSGKSLIDSYSWLHSVNHNHSLSIWRPKLDFLKDLSLDQANYPDLCKLTYLEYCLPEKRKTVRFIIDKNPVYSLYINDLLDIFPKAKFIVISRDPRDNFVSRKKHTKGIVSNWTTSLANSWKMYYQSILKNSTRFPDKFHFIKYESLTENSSHEMQRIQDFLQVKGYSEIKDPDPEQMNVQVSKSELSDESKRKVFEMHKGLKKSTNRDRVNVWKQELTKKEIWFLYYFSSKVAQKIGYEMEDNQNAIQAIKFFPIILVAYPIHLLTHQLFFFVYYSLSFELKKRIFK